MLKMDFGGGEDILFEKRGLAGVITLNRPQTLHAVNHRMVKALARALDAWEQDAAINLVIIRAEGRAFSAGGDIVDVYKAGKAGGHPVSFFADEYRLNAAIARFPKPYVALIDGIVMGGGVGVAFHGSHRVVSENALFAMPEVGIGFFPDVGGSHLLSRTADAFGMYLALTGNRIRWGDLFAVGLATHCAPAEAMPGILDALCETGEVDTILASVHADVSAETDASGFEAIARYFSHDSLNAVIAALERGHEAGNTFAEKTLAIMKKRSPTSLHVTFRQIRAGAALSMDDCMRLEYRILNRMLDGRDFYEGIRAVLIDKDGAPQWQPGTLAEIEPSQIDAYFAPLPDGELAL